LGAGPNLFPSTQFLSWVPVAAANFLKSYLFPFLKRPSDKPLIATSWRFPARACRLPTSRVLEFFLLATMRTPLQSESYDLYFPLPAAQVGIVLGRDYPPLFRPREPFRAISFPPRNRRRAEWPSSLEMSSLPACRRYEACSRTHLLSSPVRILPCNVVLSQKGRRQPCSPPDFSRKYQPRCPSVERREEAVKGIVRPVYNYLFCVFLIG